MTNYNLFRARSYRPFMAIRNWYMLSLFRTFLFCIPLTPNISNKLKNRLLKRSSHAGALLKLFRRAFLSYRIFFYVTPQGECVWSFFGIISKMLTKSFLKSMPLNSFIRRPLPVHWFALHWFLYDWDFRNKRVNHISANAWFTTDHDDNMRSNWNIETFIFASFICNIYRLSGQGDQLQLDNFSLQIWWKMDNFYEDIL